MRGDQSALHRLSRSPLNTIRALSRLAIWTVITAIFCLSVACAHPVAQGSVEIRILPDAVTAHFRVSNEQIFVAESIGPNAKPATSLEELCSMAHHESES
jgi:hypothetical protein